MSKTGKPKHFTPRPLRHLAAVCVLLAALLCGCAAQPEPETQMEQTAEDASETNPLRWHVKTTELSTGAGTVSFQDALGGGFLALVNHKTGDALADGQNETYENDLYRYTSSGRRYRIWRYEPLPAPKYDGDAENADTYRSEMRPMAFRYGQNRRILCIEHSYERWLNRKTSPQFTTRDRYYIRVLDAEGAELSCAEIDGAWGSEGLDCGSLICLEEDLLAVPHGKTVLFFGTDGKERFSVTTPLPIQELCRIAPNRIAVILRQDGASWLSIVDAEARTVTVPQELPRGAHLFCTGDEDESLLFLRNSEIFRLLPADWTVKRVTSLLSLGIDPVSVAAVYTDGDGRLNFLLHDWQADLAAVREVWLTAAQTEEQEEGIALTLGFYSISGSLKDALLSFNREQNAVSIEPIDRNNLDTAENSALQTDLMVLSSAEEIAAAETSGLADLGPFLRSDPDFSPDALIPSVHSALTGADGSLRVLAGSFRIETMVCDAGTVYGNSSLKTEDLENILSSMPLGSTLYEPWYTSDRLLEDLLAVNPDAAPGTARYAILSSFSSHQPQSYDYTDFAADQRSVESRIYAGTLLMMQAHIATLQELKWYDAFFDSGACFVGWPTEDGSAARIVFDELLAVSAFCTADEAAAAWQFLRLLLREDYAESCYGFPVRQDALDALMEQDMRAVSYRVDEDGEFETDRQGRKIEAARSVWYSPEWRRHYEYALTEVQRAKLLRLIAGAR